MLTSSSGEASFVISVGTSNITHVFRVNTYDTYSVLYSHFSKPISNSLTTTCESDLNITLWLSDASGISYAAMKN